MVVLFLCEGNIFSDTLSTCFDNILIFKSILFRNSGRITAEIHHQVTFSLEPAFDHCMLLGRNHGMKGMLPGNLWQAVRVWSPQILWVIKSVIKYYLVYFQLVLFFRPDSVIEGNDYSQEHNISHLVREAITKHSALTFHIIVVRLWIHSRSAHHYLIDRNCGSHKYTYALFLHLLKQTGLNFSSFCLHKVML